MKNIATCVIMAIVAIMTTTDTQAQQRVDSHIEGVTLFLEGAQVTRTAEATLSVGEQRLNFTGISSLIDANSLQVRAKGPFTVLAVECIEEFDSCAYEQRCKDIEANINEQEEKLQKLNVRAKAIESEIDLLARNCSTQSTSVDVIRTITSFYAERTAELNEELLDVAKRVETTQERLTTLRRALRQEGESKDSMKSISVLVDASKACDAHFTIDYFVAGAGWLPFYEIRVGDLTSPMTVVQRARVFQNTGEEWNNVALTLSSTRPSDGNIAPELRRYDLDYGLAAPRYDNHAIQRVSGYVFGDSEPKAGVSVVVEGTSIGVTTDLNGYYTLALPANAKRLVFKAQGYDVATRNITSTTCNVTLHRPAAGVAMQKRLSAEKRAQYSVDSEALNSLEAEAYACAEASMGDAYYVEMDVVESQLGYEYHIKRSYTVPSGGRATTVDIARHEVGADYCYIAVPKVDDDLFLVADVPALTKLNLIPGQASVYLEDTYVGTTVLSITTSDNALLSLGRDRSIAVERTKRGDYTQRKALGQYREETISWGITLRNNRAEGARVILYDQIPVSLRSEIEVTADNISGGKLDAETGIITWDVNLAAGKQRDIVLQYKVRYPKNKRLVVE